MNPHAVSLAMRGLRVFALAPGAKYPAATGWQAAATADPVAAMDLIPEAANVGIDTTGLFVIDVDAGKGGLEALEVLKSFGELPPTFTVRSARGGLHLYFKPREGEKFRSRAHRVIPDAKGRETETFALAGFKGIDVRADGGLVVGPGSTFAGQPYEIAADLDIATLPNWVADLARAAAPRLVATAGTQTDVELDQPDAILRATAYLMAAPPAIEGQGGDNHTIIVANKVMDYGIAPDTAADLMAEHWDVRCVPEWGLEDLRRKCRSAANGRHDKLGREIRDDVFSVVDTIISPASAPIASGSLLGFPSDISLTAILARQDRELLQGLIGPGDFGALYGPSGAGKSFLALEIAYCVALGTPWHGRRVRRAAVLYVSMEGMDGFKKRILAAKDRYGDTGLHFAWLMINVSLTRSDLGAQGAAKVVEAVAELRAKSGAEEVLVIFDTLARAMAGDDENSTEAMGYFVEQRAAAIQRLANAAVMVVHHTAKGSGDMRGSSVLRGASDFILKVDAKEKARTLIAEKVKDGEEGPLFNYALKQVRLKDEHGADARDSFGALATTCVVETGLSPRAQSAGSAAIEILMAAFAADPDLNLSPSPKAKNYAPRWLEQNRGITDFVAADFEAALPTLLVSPFEAVAYSNKGKPAQRIKIRDDNSKIVSGDAVFT